LYCFSFDLDVEEGIAQLYVDMLRGMPGHAAGTISIVQAAGQGDLQAVKDIIRTSPDKVLAVSKCTYKKRIF
jgi:hypothetical protein